MQQRRDDLEAELRRWVAKVGAERLYAAVVGAFVGRGLPVQGEAQSGRKRAPRKPRPELPA